jgi:hypothetical protein
MRSPAYMADAANTIAIFWKDHGWRSVWKEEFMSRLRVLVLGPGCNPEQASMPYVTHSHAAALAQLHDVTLVIASPVEGPDHTG